MSSIRLKWPGLYPPASSVIGRGLPWERHGLGQAALRLRHLWMGLRAKGCLLTTFRSWGNRSVHGKGSACCIPVSNMDVCRHTLTFASAEGCTQLVTAAASKERKSVIRRTDTPLRILNFPVMLSEYVHCKCEFKLKNLLKIIKIS